MAKNKIIDMRAVQIQNGLKPFIDVPSDIIDSAVNRQMIWNYNKRKYLLSFFSRRPVSLYHYEYWPVEELEIYLMDIFVCIVPYHLHLIYILYEYFLNNIYQPCFIMNLVQNILLCFLLIFSSTIIFV